MPIRVAGVAGAPWNIVAIDIMNTQMAARTTRVGCGSVERGSGCHEGSE